MIAEFCQRQIDYFESLPRQSRAGNPRRGGIYSAAGKFARRG